MTPRFQFISATAVAAALALCAPGLAAEPAAAGDYSSEISALRERLNQLELQQKTSEQQRQQAELKLQEKITSDELSRESVQHDQFISAEGFTAGYSDNRFVIQSGDGNFVLRPWAHLQFRAVAADREGFQGNKIEGREDQWDDGFEVRRMRLGFDGNMFSPDLSYFFNWNTYRSSANSTVTSSTGATVGTVNNGQGGTLYLEEAWVKYHIPTTPYSIQVGQLRDPVLHDQIVDARYQQSAERSLTADLFANGDGYTEGVMFVYDPQTDIRAEGGINHGMRSANTNFLSYPDNGALNQFNYGFAGRFEYKAMGRWRDYNQVGAVGVSAPLMVVGVGADYSERGHAGQLVAAADVTYASPAGCSFYGALVDRYTTHNFGLYTQSTTGATITTPGSFIANSETNEYSLLLQAGYIFDRKLEPFARYEFIHLEGDANGSKNWINCITAGVNYYMYGNRMKLTAEAIWLPNGLPVDDSSSDSLISPSGRAEISLLAQLQFAL